MGCPCVGDEDKKLSHEFELQLKSLILDLSDIVRIHATEEICPVVRFISASTVSYHRAEEQGFEPWEQLPVHRISSAARSTTPAFFLWSVDIIW